MRLAKWSQAFRRQPPADELLDRQEKQWTQLGQHVPYWSVISGYNKTQTLDDADYQAFYHSGEDDIEFMRRFFQRAGWPVPSGRCVDWGCGLGRVCVPLTSVFDQVFGVDISGSHLQLAREHVARLDGQVAGRLSFLHLTKDRAAITKLKGTIDLVHSILVLQHMPPPLMRQTLTTFAQLLKKGGCAFFQIPTFGEGYDYETYNLEHGGEFDMHVLAQHEVHAIFREQRCHAIATFEKDNTGPGYLSHYFIFQKQ